MATQTVTASGTASSGASKTSGMPAAHTDGADYSMSDLELLGVVDEPAAEEQAEKRSGADQAQSKPPAGTGKGASTNPRAEQEGEGALAQFAPAFELPGVGPKLREICERENAYREVFPSVEEARAVREVFPSAEAARAAATAQSELARLDALVESRDPRAHAELVAGLQRLAPESIRSLAQAFVEQLPQLDAEAFREVTQKLAGHAAEQPPDVPGVNSRPAANQLESADAGARHAVPLQASAEHRAAQIQATQAAGEFLEAVNADVQQAMRTAVEQKVGELLPDAPEGARQKISGEIFRDLDLALRGDQELQELVRDAVRGVMQTDLGAMPRPGAWRDLRNERADKSVRATGSESLARLIARRAKAALPGVAKRVVADWTESVLRSSQARRARQSEAANRAEIGRGGPPAPVPATTRRVDYNRMSDEEILNMD